MILGNQKIEALMKEAIIPWDDKNLQPASYDLRLGNQWKIPYVEYTADFFTLPAGMMILATTLEEVRMPDHVAGLIRARSSASRLGLTVVNDGGYVDPGFCGKLTLAIVNHSGQSIELKYAQRVCQLVLMEVDGCTMASGL